MAFAELKARHSVVWGNGPYERVTNTIRDIHDLVIARIDPQPGEKLLDAATGTGAVAILAAGRGADVTGQDIAPVLVETARERAAEEGVDVQFEVGDAEAMSYEDATFDIVTSTCGVMFAPDHEAVAGELARVTRSGGRIALVCWQPGKGMADVFQMMAPYMPPSAPGAGSPFAWGDRDHVTELLGDSFELHFEEGDSPVTLAVRRGVLGALLHVLRTDEDGRRVARPGAARGVPSRLGRLRSCAPRGRCDGAPPRVPAHARDAPLGGAHLHHVCATPTERKPSVR